MKLERAEARADLERAGRALADLDVHDDAIGRGAFLFAQLDALEVAELLDLCAALLGERLAVELALDEPHLAPDDAVPRLRVAEDVDALDAHERAAADDDRHVHDAAIHVEVGLRG
jgi:hypothetical protein